MKRFISVCFLVLCCASWCLAQDNAEQPSWKLLTNSLGLRAGDQIIIAVADNDLSSARTQNVMGTYGKHGNKLGYAATTVDYNSSDSTIVVTNSVTVLTLVEDSVPGVFSLSVGNGQFLCATSSNNRYLQPKFDIEIEDDYNKLFDIWINQEGNAQITGYGYSTKNQILCSVNGKNKMFVCDTPGSASENVRIFMLTDPNRAEAEDSKLISDTLLLVKNIEDLVLDENVIIASAGADYAIGAISLSDGRIRAGFTEKDDTIFQYSPAAQSFTIAQGASAGTYAFVVNGAYMSSESGLPLTSNLSDASWTVSINSNGNATLTSNGRYISYDDDAQRFQSSTTSASVRFYKRVNKLVNVKYMELDEIVGVGNNIILTTKGQTHQVPIFTSDPADLGRTFIEWNTKRDGTGIAYSPSNDYIISKSLTLFPQWQMNVSSDTYLPLRDDMKGTRVVVENGATLMADDIITIHNLTLKGGRTTSGDYIMPSVYLEDWNGIELINKTIYFDLSVNMSNYYPFAVPFPVAVNKVDYADPTLAKASVYGTHYVIKRYDGALRAENGGDKDANWVVVAENETLQPGVGYIITAVPIGGEALIRFPMTPEVLWDIDNDQTTSVIAHTGTAAMEETRHAGWNFIANPYLSRFAGQSVGDQSNLMIGSIVYVDGEWQTIGDVPYVTIPSPNFSKYEQVELAEAVLSPSYAFFVQAAQTATLSFATMGRQQYMPALRAAAVEPLRLPLMLTQATASDRTTLLVSDDYTANYEIGKDLEKMFGSAEQVSLYAWSSNTPLAYCAVPWASAIQAIPLGYRARQAGSVTIELSNTATGMNDVASVLLYDQVTGLTTDLLVNAYTFETEVGTHDARFTVMITPKQGATTGCEEVMLPTDGTYKFLRNGQLYINHRGTVYTVEGRESW